ncbi:catechol 2,3-dioxygenase-like lactoylglutathione lyase family enzyme [Paenibacillus jamilae]|uniref:VOC family protein n=1 Tax=Paenibacillus TaxID=44249 RepID=UPI000D30C997|nr:MULTISPECIES: VOC family protein [Paenibacillus]KAF6582484.1 VOC family protein [Paenibacillus sp. EKM211P]MDP9678907.1 catechol 2,3-dioxygenase-like lactoylglutathione lyase family enzyme [Paenibacillus jamilae]PTU45041.1 glyoxalase [Paenibacillus polymyxa]
MTPKQHPVRGIDHIGITVPDVEQATTFLQNAFGADICYDALNKPQPPQKGEQTEQQLGLKRGARIIHIRLLRIHEGPGIELFQLENTPQNFAIQLADYGLQHFAVYVDDMNAATARFQQAGGTLLSPPHALSGIEAGAGNQFVYGRSPWGTIIELISYPDGIRYPQESEAYRWTPPER